MRNLLFLLLIYMTGCGTAFIDQPSIIIKTGQRLIDDNFSSAGIWDQYESPEIQVRVEAGLYHMRVTRANYVWGMNRVLHDNVIIEALVQQRSTSRINGYGVMCRAGTQNDGKGYYFLISGDGEFSIRRGDVREMTSLVTWTYSDAIHQNQESNTIRAVCSGDYLAMYANDRFLAEVRDERYTAGYTGLAVVNTGRDEIDVTFDDLRVWEELRSGN